MTDEYDIPDPDNYEPIPETARGPPIPEEGYRIEAVGDGLHCITEGSYQMLVAPTDEGTVVVDAPPSIGRYIPEAVATVSDEPINHVVYTHAHADHIGAASLYPDDATYVAHAATARKLNQVDDPNRPVPDVTFENEHTLTVGDQVFDLAYHGNNHEEGNIFVYAPEQRALMLVDVIFPGWVPFKEFGWSEYLPGIVAAHDRVLDYDFETFVGGHLRRLGDREDVEIQREYVHDLRDNAAEAIESVSMMPFAEALGPENEWLVFEAYITAVTERAAAATIETWSGELGAVDVYTHSNAEMMVLSLQADYGLLGPLGANMPDAEQLSR